MKRYQIIILIITLFTGQQAWGQEIDVTDNWDHWVTFDCANTPAWNVDWSAENKKSVSCGTEANWFNGNNKVFIEYSTSTGLTLFPEGQNGLQITVGTSINLKATAIPTNRREEHHFRIVRFYENPSDPTTGTHSVVTNKNMNNWSGNSHETSYTFPEPGKYLIYAWGKFKKNNSASWNYLERHAIGWVYVLPKIDAPTNNTGATFSACYAGPDGICPDKNCECEDVTENEGTFDTDYYWVGADLPEADTDLLYQTTLQARSPQANGSNTPATDVTFYWYNQPGTPNTYKEDLLPHKNIEGKLAEATGSEIKYRVLNRPNKETHSEVIWVRAIRNGIISKNKQFTIVRNLSPIPYYKAVKDCFGYSAEFKNTSVVKGAPDAITYTWHFGDGTTVIDDDTDSPNLSSDNPIINHEYLTSGTYYPILQINYSYPGCPNRNIFSKEEDRTTFDILPIGQETLKPTYNSYEITDVLAASSASFADSWVMDLGGEMTTNEQSKLIRELNPFANGQKGLWRGEGAFAYIKDRTGTKDISYTENVDMRNHGTFELDAFNWQVGAGPNWVKANSIVEYSPYGSEIENKDVLNRYSTVLFGYNGELATAVGANMKHRELAFTSFEEEAKNVSSGFTQANSGNFNILNQSTTRLRKITVLGGTKQVAILDFPFLQIEELREPNKLLTLTGTNLSGEGGFTLEDVEVSCKFRDTRHSNQSIVRFSGAGLDALGKTWKGSLSYYETVEGVEIPSSTAQVIDASTKGIKAHTGTRCLWVKADFEQAQHFLTLEEGKEYMISAWVRVNTGNRFNVNYAELNATQHAEKLGIGIKSSSGEYLGVIEPSGTIIEGWQRLEGKFTYKKGTERLFLSFQKGSSASNKEVYFDDIRLFPNSGNMQSYVYEQGTYRLLATLDNNNFATRYAYDSEGNLFLIQKETIEGIKTIQESMSHQKGADNN